MPRVPKESQIDYYWDLVMNNDKNPSRDIVNFYLTLFGLSKAVPEDYQTIGKVVEIFGKKAAFLAVLDYFRSTERNVYESMYHALFAICRNQFEKKMKMDVAVSAYEPLDGYLKQQRKLNEKIRKQNK